MTIPLGDNIFTWDDDTRKAYDIRQPKAIIFLDNDGGAAEAAVRYPGTKVITRIVSDKYEKSMYRSSGESRRYLQMRTAQTSRLTYINLFCEPEMGNIASDLTQMSGEIVDALTWARDNKVRVAAPHGAFYGVNPEHYPYLDKMVDFIADYPDLFIFTIDEYSGGHAFSGVVDPSLPSGSEIGHIPPSTWKASPVGIYYHAGRITQYFDYRRKLGKKIPITVITEMGMDSLGDINAWLNSLHNTGTVDKTRGWQTLVPQWHDWYGDWSGEGAYVKMESALWRAVYSRYPEIIGGCLFVRGTNGDPQWNSYRTDRNSQLDNALLGADWTPEEMASQGKPNNAGVGALMVCTQDYKFRTGPGLSYGKVASITAGATLTLYPGGSVTADGHLWKWGETASASGWIADDGQFVKPDATFLEPNVYLQMDFIPQSMNSCGPASLATEVRYKEDVIGSTKWRQLNMDQIRRDMNVASGVYTYLNEPTDGKPLPGNQKSVQGVAPTYGVWYDYDPKFGPDDIVSALNKGLPSIILYERGDVPGTQTYYEFTGHHISPVIGYGKMSDGSRYFVLIDNLGKDNGKGDGLYVTEANMVKAIADASGGVIIMNQKSLAKQNPPQPSATYAQKMAYLITSMWETNGDYGAVQTYDSGLVSYGRMQATLASGNLYTLLSAYQNDPAKQFEFSSYMKAVQLRDPSLKTNTVFLDLLKKAGDDPAMQKAQDDWITNSFWNKINTNTIQTRGLVNPLSIAWCFDTGVNAGPDFPYLSEAEKELGLPYKSTAQQRKSAGVSEELLMITAAMHRGLANNIQGATQNLMGLPPRGAFFLRLMLDGDWGLNGENGVITLKPGVIIKVEDSM